jgi:hypothetical protein
VTPAPIRRGRAEHRGGNRAPSPVVADPQSSRSPLDGPDVRGETVRVHSDGPTLTAVLCRRRPCTRRDHHLDEVRAGHVTRDASLGHGSSPPAPHGRHSPSSTSGAARRHDPGNLRSACPAASAVNHPDGSRAVVMRGRRRQRSRTAGLRGGRWRPRHRDSRLCARQREPAPRGRLRPEPGDEAPAIWTAGPRRPIRVYSLKRRIRHPSGVCKAVHESGRGDRTADTTTFGSARRPEPAGTSRSERVRGAHAPLVWSCLVTACGGRAGLGRRSHGHRPGERDPVWLQPEIRMQAGCAMPLDHEDRSPGRLANLARRLWRRIEVASPP